VSAITRFTPDSGGSQSLTPVGEARARLGEGPVWDARERALYWVDIRAPALHRLEPATGAARTWPMPAAIGSVALRETGGPLVALRSGLHVLDLESGTLTLACALEPERTENRLNDGRCDRRGRFWVGSMHDRDGSATGALYRVDSDRRSHRILDGITVPNGLGWSPDGRVMYFTDSSSRTIHAYDFDLDAGVPSARRVFARVPDDAGYPDGATVDAEGFLWSAHWDGWRVTRYAPDGRVDRVIRLPVQRPTCCAFGGDGLDVLYVTSAAVGLGPADLARSPLAGGLFAVEVGVRGLSEPRYAG
jgi:sugar lactone lactonase YvrE